MESECSSNFRKKKVPQIQKSLAILLQSLYGIAVVVEMKNDMEVSGILLESDAAMNVTLQDARQISASGISLDMEFVFLNGSSIRYVHIPKEINIVKHMNDYVSMHGCFVFPLNAEFSFKDENY